MLDQAFCARGQQYRSVTQIVLSNETRVTAVLAPELAQREIIKGAKDKLVLGRDRNTFFLPAWVEEHPEPEKNALFRRQAGR